MKNQPIDGYLSGALNHELLSHEETMSLIKQAQAGDKEAAGRLVTFNQRLVHSIASKYIKLGMYAGCAIEDLMQFGNIGLLTAIRKFDPEKTGAFSTYATIWIKSVMTRKGARASNQFAVGTGRLDRVRTVRYRQTVLENKLHRPVTADELAKGGRETKEFVQFCIDYTDQITELDAPTDHNGQLSLHDVIPSGFSWGDVDNKLDAEFLDRLIEKLPNEAQKFVIRQRFLANGGSTAEEVSKMIGKSRTRVQQIEKAGIKNLQAALQSMGTTFEGLCGIAD